MNPDYLFKQELSKEDIADLRARMKNNPEETKEMIRNHFKNKDVKPVMNFLGKLVPYLALGEIILPIFTVEAFGFYADYQAVANNIPLGTNISPLQYDAVIGGSILAIPAFAALTIVAAKIKARFDTYKFLKKIKQ